MSELEKILAYINQIGSDMDDSEFETLLYEVIDGCREMTDKINNEFPEEYEDDTD